MTGVVFIRWHVPCTEPIMITAILDNLWIFDCQITKTYTFEIFLRYRPHCQITKTYIFEIFLRYRPNQCQRYYLHCYLSSRKSPDPELD